MCRAFFTCLTLIATSPLAGILSGNEISVGSYPSIQAALEANPNRMIYVPAGDHIITHKIRIRGERSGIYGPGRIIQQNSDQPIIEIESAVATVIRDVTLLRPEGKMETSREGLIATDCRELTIENVRVIDNHSKSAAILLASCHAARISHCVVQNYMRVSIDDRTQGTTAGYAFNCTDGTGISLRYCTGSFIEGNRIVEKNFLPTRQVRDQYELGKFVKKNPEKGPHINQQAWDAGYTDNWRQGSAVIVTGPETSDFTRITGNYIENAAQGIDLHCDRTIVSNNIVNHAHIGMKAMHGSRNVLIIGNQFSRNDLWAIGLMPGAAAHPAVDGKAANSDGGSVIANNIVSDFGHGEAHWMWGMERSPFKFDGAQDPDDPPLQDVIIQGNLVYNPGPPRYKYAVIVSSEPSHPRNLQFGNNLLPPGTHGVANIELSKLPQP